MKKLKNKLILLGGILRQTVAMIKAALSGELVLIDMKDLPPEKPAVEQPSNPEQYYQPEVVPMEEFGNDLRGLLEVPAERIIQAAQSYGPNNSYHQLLLTAKVYQQMGVEPVFLITPDQSALRVAAKELYEKPYALN
jgi:hypothetical protein